MDRYSLLSNEDLQAIAANDWSRVSTRGLQIIAGEREPEPTTAARAPASTERTWGEVPRDIGAQALSGLGALIKFPGQLYGLATGDFRPIGNLGLGQRVQERAEQMKSPGLRAREEQLTERIQEAEQRGQTAAFMEALKGTFTDPALLGGAVVESVPAMIPALGLGAAAARTVTQRALAKGAEAAAARAAGAAAGVGTAKGVGAVQQGAEVGAEAYKDLNNEFLRQGLSEQEAAKRTLNAARAAGASGAIISYLAQSLPGASALEEAIITGQRRVVGRMGAGIAGGLKEAPSEAIEEGGGRATQNVAMREAIPDQPISAGVGEAAGRAAAAGLGLGAGVGAIQRGPVAQPAPPAPPPPPVQPTGGPILEPSAPAGTQSALFTEAEAPSAPTPEGLAQNKAYYNRLQNQLDQLIREQTQLRTQADAATDPAVQEQLRQRSVAVTTQISNVAGEMARYAPTIPSVAQEPRIDTEARGEEAARVQTLEEQRRQFDTLQRENERLKAEYERAAVLEDRVKRVQETTRIRAEAARIAPELERLQAAIQQGRRTVPTEAAQRTPTAEGQLDLRFDDTIRLEDLPGIGVPIDGGTNAQRAVRGWFRDNVIGRTPDEVRTLIQRDPSLLQGSGLRARALAQLVSTEPAPPAFQEQPREPSPVPAASKPAAPVQGEFDFGGTEPSVEVPERPAQPSVSAAPPAQPAAPAPGGLGGSGVSAAPGAGAQAAPAGALTPTAPAAEDESEQRRRGFEDWLGRVIKKRVQEAAGQDILDEMEDQGVSPKDSARTFWRETYFKLPAEAQRRFQRLLKAETGMEPGSPITADRRAADWLEIADDYIENELPNTAGELEGTARGFIALMEEGNRRTRDVAPAAPTPPAPAITAPAVDQEAEAAAKKAEAAAKRKARAEARKAEAEARKAEAEARAAEEAAKQAEEAAKQAEAEAARRAEEEAEAKRRADEEAAKQKKEAAAAKRKATREAKKATEPATPAEPEWVTKAEQDLPASTRVAFDGDTLVLMVMRKSKDGNLRSYFYIADEFNGITPLDSDLAKATFPPEAIQYATAQLSIFSTEEKARVAAYPDGPFTDSKEPVVGTDALGPKYAQFLNELYKKLGLERTGARILLTTIRPDSAMRDKYRLYGPYARALTYRGEAVRGYHIGYGIGSGDILIAVDPDLDAQILLEVIGHEFGHAIQRIMYDNAPKATRDAIHNEYEAWYKKVVKGTTEEFIRSRMTPRRAEESLASSNVDMQASPTTLTDANYWLKFDEWFADQVARWVVTDDKPVGIVEKFFASIAAKMRKLVALLGKKETAPAASVKKFLDEMYAGTREMQDIADSWRPAMPMAPPAPLRKSLVDMPEAQTDELQVLSAAMNPAGGTSLGMAQSATSFLTKFRTRVADKGATALEAISDGFNGAVRNTLNDPSLEPLYRQAEASDQLIPAYLRMGSIIKEKATGLWRAATKPGLVPPAEILNIVGAWGNSRGLSFQEAWVEAGKIMESARQKEFKDLNASMAKGRQFPVSMSDADINKYYGIYSTDATFNKTLRKVLDEARFDMIDNMVRVGRIPQEMADDWKTATAYIPFDRVEDIEKAFRAGRRFGRGIAQLGNANPELVDVATVDRQVKNTLDNYFNWLGWGVRQVVQTDATINTLRALEQVGQAKFLPGGTAQLNSNNKQRRVMAYSKGNEIFFEVPSAYHAAAFNMQITPLPAIFGVMNQFSTFLRTAITAIPTFTATQIPQDIQRAIMYSGVKDPAMLTARTLSNFTEYSQAAILGKLPQVEHELGEYGVAGDFDFRMDGAADSFLKSMGVKPRKGGVAGEFVQRLSDIARASDFALRRAIYEQTLYEGGDQLLALHRAREIINFRRYGMGDQFGVLHILTQTVPFYNAYIQGMDVLYRSLTGEDAPSGVDRKQALKQFYTTALYASSVAVLYALGKAGDEEYENMDLRERDKTWVLGGGFGIPVPGELGILFKALPERVLEAMRKQGTPDEAVAAEAVVSWFRAAFDEYAGRGAIPAPLKPILENLTNYSFLSGRTLEGTYQAGLLPSERTTSRTSELAKTIARFTADTTGIEISPIKIDNFLQGYLGTTAGLTFAVTDSLINPGKMDRPLHQIIGLTAFTYDPVGTRRASEFYDLREKVVQSQNTLNELMKTDLNRAADFAEKNADRLMLYKAVNSTLKEIQRTRSYRNWLNSADAGQTLSQKERADQMEAIKRYEQQLFEWTRDIRNHLKL